MNDKKQDLRGDKSPRWEEFKDVVGGKRLTYEEYVAILDQSKGKTRNDFELCFNTIPLGFKGQIEKRSKDKICFKRIFIEGMYPDGLCYEGKEDHVWMDAEGFQDYQEGESLSFFADVYRYLKTGNGKVIDFGLRNPKDITLIDSYELPTDEELIRQEIDSIICETCFLNEQCFGNCLLPKGKRKKMVDEMYRVLQSSNRKTQQ